MLQSQREKLEALQSQNGPSKEFEEFYYRQMEPNVYREKYGAKNKQTLMPPAYICKKNALKSTQFHQGQPKVPAKRAKKQ